MSSWAFLNFVLGWNTYSICTIFTLFREKKNFFMCGNGGKELEFREDYFLKKELIFYKNTFLQSTAVLLFKPNLPLDDAFAQIFSLRSISHLEWFYFWSTLIASSYLWKMSFANMYLNGWFDSGSKNYVNCVLQKLGFNARMYVECR